MIKIIRADYELQCDGCGYELNFSDRNISGTPRTIKKIEKKLKKDGWQIKYNSDTIEHEHYCRQCAAKDY